MCRSFHFPNSRSRLICSPESTRSNLNGTPMSKLFHRYSATRKLGVPKRVDTGDIVILGEGLFHAKAEAHLPDKVLILTLVRPFMNKGTDSIWQVVKMEEKKSGTKSG